MGSIIKNQSTTYVIAEIGNNHNGDFRRACELVKAAHSAGADCVKFQLRSLKSVYRKRSLEMLENDLATEYVLDLLEKYSLSVKEHQELKGMVDDLGLDYMCTPWDVESVAILESFGIEQYKIASADFTNLSLIKRVLETEKPVFLSCGMTSLDEIGVVLEFLKEYPNYLSILHCNSTYPAPFSDLNLRFISTLKEMCQHRVGYSGHERGIACSVAAVALGATVIERHITLDTMLEGPDHAASLLPKDFAELVKSIREVEIALGNGKIRDITQGELINRENLSKSLIAAMPIKIGEVLKEEHFAIRSPGMGLSPLKMPQLIGKTATRNFEFEDFFFESDLEEVNEIDLGQISFPHRIGIPVRFHDLQQLAQKFSPYVSFFEFHLSYKDLDVPTHGQFDRFQDHGFVVHAPELFENSALLDLCSTDESYRLLSVNNLRRTIDKTLEVKDLFPSEKRPRIVTNIGGFSRDEFLSPYEIEKRYENFERSISEVDQSGVEIIPQTMAPFPWHFGGQRFQNLMMSTADVKRICESNGLRICLDVSHTQLYCNVFDQNIEEYIENVGKFVTHLHISDTNGAGGEGLQIGEGNSDLRAVMAALAKHCPNASFIPEVWQGHKNFGAGFAFALMSLFKVQSSK